ncbi:MAG: biotin attachment protein, partial [Gammaproteobacteria bacterium]|nr:biotin attachment protein [Gammaproteobacteria bacterium]
IPFFPMPGGALTANTQMLRDNNLMDRYPEVIAAMGEAVKKGGFGTSVTPVSQFYFQQAFNNVMFGPWKKIAEGYGSMVLGYLGKTPVAPDAEVVKIAAEQLKLPPTTNHLTALEQNPKLGSKVAIAALERAGLPVNDENIFIAASCEEKGIAFLEGRGAIGVRKNQPKKPEVAPKAAAGGAATYNVVVNAQSYSVRLDGGTAVVDGQTYNVDVTECAPDAAAATADGAKARAGTEIVSQLPGNVLHIAKNVGAKVGVGDVIMVIESLKMENPIVSPVSGTIGSLNVKQGEQIQAGKVLALVLT